MDKEQKTFDQFMKEHPEYNWDILYIGPDHEIVKNYKVETVPAYFLIDQGGYIAAAPALRPSPDGEYESIDKTFFFIQKMLHPDKPINVGEP